MTVSDLSVATSQESYLHPPPLLARSSSACQVLCFQPLECLLLQGLSCLGTVQGTLCPALAWGGEGKQCVWLEAPMLGRSMG